MKEDGRNPLDLSDEEIEERYKNAWQGTVGNYRPEIQASLLSIEMNKRFLRKSTKENEKLIAQNQKLSKRSIYISGVALLIAITTACFSYYDLREDEAWQNEQIKELSLVVEKLDRANELMTQHIAEGSNRVESENTKMEMLSEIVKQLQRIDGHLEKGKTGEGNREED